MSTRAHVTGAARFIGSNVADHYMTPGMEVVGTDGLSGAFVVSVPREVAWVQRYVRDPVS